MHLAKLHHSNLNFHLTRSDLNKFILSHSIREFVLAFISIFLPFFLLDRGFSIQLVVLFYLIYFGSGIFFTYLSLRLVSKYGARRNMIIGFLFLFLFYFLMYNFDKIQLFLGDLLAIFLVAITIIIGDQLYWMGMHSELGRNLSRKKASSQIGSFFIFTTFATSIAPLLGAFIITSYSYKTSFLLVMFLLLFASIPILFAKDIGFNQKIYFKKAYTKSSRRENTLFIFEGINNIGLSFVWPLLMYFANFSLILIGSLVFVLNLFHSLAFYISGKYSNRIKKLFKYGSYGTGISMILRSIFLNPYGAFFFQGLGAISVPFMTVPLHEYFYSLVKKNHLQSIYNREAYLSISRFITLLVILVFISIFPVILGFIIIMMILSISTILMGNYYFKYVATSN